MKGIIKWGKENRDLIADDYSDRCNRNPKDDSNPCWVCHNNNWVLNTCKLNDSSEKEEII